MIKKRPPLIRFSRWHVWKYLWRTRQYVGVFHTPKDAAPHIKRWGFYILGFEFGRR